MTARAVHWHDGMFLRPHHFQAAQRHDTLRTLRNVQWTGHYCWGLRKISIDADALGNQRFVVDALQIRLRDGSLVDVPGDGTLPALDLKAAFETRGNVTVFLGLPVLNLGKANAVEDDFSDGARFRIDTQELEDENTGVNPQPVQVRLMNVRLLVSGEDQTGYEVLPIARLERSTSAEGGPQIDATYIPPLLACDGWRPLNDDILRSLYDRIGKKLELMAEQVVTRGISFDSDAQGDPLIFEQLRSLNESYALLGVLAFAQGVPPFQAFTELCHLVGRLAVFGPTRRTPALPRYDHDDLGLCFIKVKQQLDALLDAFLEPGYKERPFVGAGLRMQVALEPAWMEASWGMYIGVQSPLSAEDVIRLLTVSGQLDMKVGSSDRVDAIFRLGQQGLRFKPAQVPPRVLPVRQGLIYFEIDRIAHQAEWQNVQRSLALAIRLNENRIVGSIQDARVLSIKSGSQTTTLQFTLYVVPQQ